MSTPQTWRVDDMTAVPADEAEAAWATHAHAVLTDVAKEYGGLINHVELGAEVQRRSGIQTRSQVQKWIGRVLEPVAQQCHSQGEPPLTALVIQKTDGMVGENYDAVIKTTGQSAIKDDLKRELHAGESRLECYRRYSQDLPADGGRAMLSPQLQLQRQRQQDTRRRYPVEHVCTTCFTVLPTSGICDGASH